MVCTGDCVWDFTSVGGPKTHGIGETLEVLAGTRTPRALKNIDPGLRPMLSHHSTNIEILDVRGDSVNTRCKYFRVSPQGVIAGTYYDELVRTSEGWRISNRRVVAHG